MEDKTEKVSFKDKMIKLIVEAFSASNEAPADAKVEYTFKDMKLDDGVTIVSVDEDFVKDAILYVVDDSGRNPAEKKDYTLEDGRVIVVGEAGVILEVKEAEAVEEAMKAVDKTASLEERIKGIEDTLVLLVQGIQTNKTAEVEKFSKLKAENETLKAEKTKLENAPMVKPTVIANFSAEKGLNEMTRLERIEALRESKENK
jgi:hypothetical protein